MRRRVLIGAASLLIAAGALAGCGVNAESSATAPIAATSAPSGPVINLSSLTFDPASTTVQVGTTVTWRNDEPITHTISSGRFNGVDKTTGLRSSEDPDGTFEAMLPGKGKTFSFAFTKPGTYPYYATFTVVANSTQW
jgi:plastocyanin